MKVQSDEFECLFLPKMTRQGRAMAYLKDSKLEFVRFRYVDRSVVKYDVIKEREGF